MYELAGDSTNKYFNYADPMYDRDSVVQLCPPARQYIKKSFEGIIRASRRFYKYILQLR
jgi:hypothetical protein